MGINNTFTTQHAAIISLPSVPNMESQSVMNIETVMTKLNSMEGTAGLSCKGCPADVL